MELSEKTIHFFSNSTSTAEYVKLKLEDQIEQRGLEVQIEEITDLGEISSKGIMSLPAVSIDDQCFELSEDDPVSLANKAVRYLLKSLHKPQRPTIVVPTDFSAASKNAIEYGVSLAKQLSADIKLLHVQRVEYAIDLKFDTDSTVEAATQDLLNDELVKVETLLDNENLTATADIRTGFAGEKILEFAEAIPNAVLIMGTTGNSNNLKKYIGSVSTMVASKIKVPVLLVPPNYSSKVISSVVYCAKDEQLDVAVIDQFLQIMNATKANVNVVNMSDNKAYDEQGYMDILKAHYPQNKIRYTNVNTTADYSSINEYAKQIEADMIVVSTVHRDRLSKIFHSSFSFKLAIHTELPLLILHKY